MEINYRFDFPDRESETFTIRLSDDTRLQPTERHDRLPEWTELTYRMCPHCTLAPEAVSHCPLSVAIADITDRFEALRSFTDTTVYVTTEERNYSSETTVQRGLSSLLGLVIATSGCPHTDFLRPMAHFHLPLSTPEETVFRAVGMYFIGRFFRTAKGEKCDFHLAGLNELYAKVETVNFHVAARLRAVTSRDAPINAIVLLDNLAKNMAIAIEDQLEGIRLIWDHEA